MGRKLPKKMGYARNTLNNSVAGKFPNCIGNFPECKDYTGDMSLDNRPECKSCPFRS